MHVISLSYVDTVAVVRIYLVLLRTHELKTLLKWLCQTSLLPERVVCGTRTCTCMLAPSAVAMGFQSETNKAMQMSLLEPYSGQLCKASVLDTEPSVLLSANGAEVPCPLLHLDARSLQTW